MSGYANGNAMKTAKEHYDQQLAAIYSWMSGGADAALERNRELFRRLELENIPRGLAIDLGAGAGFQSVPLAELGFSVTALDLSPQLLAELREQADGLPIRTVQDDLLNFKRHIDEQAQLVVCMGDTLTHLESKDSVQSLLSSVGHALADGGMLVLTFRDYVSVELQGAKRFIPVRSDETKILTCLLEYREEMVEVYDLIYRNEGVEWTLDVSSYPKLRLDQDWVSSQLVKEGLRVIRNEVAQGMVIIVARKD
jgi:SAM-dependent methyltransferase